MNRIFLKKKSSIIFFFSFLFVFFAPASQTFSKELVVGIKHSPPFVIIDDSKNITGYSIDLLENVIDHLDENMTIRYKIDPDIIEHINSVKNSEVDLGISATTIISEREKIIEFSQPFFTTELGIVINTKVGKKSIFKEIVQSAELFSAIFWLFIYLGVFAHLFWMIERGENLSSNYFRGIAEGFWWMIVTISTVGYGDFVPKKVLGRIVGGLAILSGIVFFSVSTASLTTLLTVQTLKYNISGPNDLSGKKVGVIDETIAEEEIEKLQAKIVNIHDIEEGIQLLKNKEIDAFVHDKPILQYVLKKRKETEVTLLDTGFAPSNYGITFPLGSKLRKDVNLALLTILEDNKDFIKKLNRKWFGH